MTGLLRNAAIRTQLAPIYVNRWHEDLSFSSAGYAMYLQILRDTYGMEFPAGTGSASHCPK